MSFSFNIYAEENKRARLLSRLVALLCILGVYTVYGQEETQQESSQEEQEINYKFWSFGGGIGFMAYSGDLTPTFELGTFNNSRLGYYGFLERRMNKVLSIGFNTYIGKLSENASNELNNLNFETDVQQYGIDLGLHFDHVIFKKSALSPFFTIGMSLLSFDPFGDNLDDMGNQYHYWSDGSIRIAPEGSANDVPETKRDYNYETHLDDSSSYPRSALTFPLGFGVSFRLSSAVEMKISSTLNLVGTDYIDNLSENGDNDRYVYTSVGMTFNLGRKDNIDVMYDDVDFKGIKNEDSDNDGVKDIEDNCQNTPAGIPVDKTGCPFDDDNDGVPNHLDKESGTRPGAIVDASGKALTEEQILALQTLRDSLATTRWSSLYDNPNARLLKDVDMQVQRKNYSSGLPDQYLFADTNNNGIIESSEITDAIDGFFEGLVDATIQQLYDLIDYFFEQ